MGGFGSAVLEMCEQHGALHAGLHRLGLPDRFIEHAPRPRQLEKLGLTPEHIADLVRGYAAKLAPAGLAPGTQPSPTSQRG